MALRRLRLLQTLTDPDLTLLHLGEEHGPRDLLQAEERHDERDPCPDPRSRVDVGERRATLVAAAFRSGGLEIVG